MRSDSLTDAPRQFQAARCAMCRTTPCKRHALYELLADAQCGSHAALNSLCSAIYPIIVRFVRTRVIGQWDPRVASADVTQETMLGLLMSLPHCRATTSGEVIAWALGIARHVLADVYRSPEDSARAQRRTVAITAIAEHPIDCDGMSLVLSDLADGSACESRLLRSRGDQGAIRLSRLLSLAPSNPSRRSSATSESVLTSLDRVADPLLRLVLAAYESLPSDTAAIFWSHLIANETWEETGSAIGLTAGAAKRRYQRAQGLIRRNVLAEVEYLPPLERDAVEARLCVNS